MILNIETTITSLFKIVAVRPDGTERVLADWFPNLVTNLGLNLFGDYDQPDNKWYHNICCVGSSNVAPSTGNTALGNFVAEAGLSQDGYNMPVGTYIGGTSATAPYYAWQRVRARFGIGVATGNLSEVGVGSTSTRLFSRALILDNLGAPTTITVLSDEILDVYWEVRQYYDAGADKDYTFTIDGVVTAVKLRAALVTNGISGVWYYALSQLTTIAYGNQYGKTYHYPATLGTVTQEPASNKGAWPGLAGDPNNYNTMTFGYSYGQYGAVIAVQPYTQNTFYRDIKVSFMPDDQNYPDIPAQYREGIGAMLLSTTRGVYQMLFTPAVVKTASKRMDITLRVSWARRP